MSQKLSSLYIYFLCVLFFSFLFRVFFELDRCVFPHIRYGLSFQAVLCVTSVKTQHRSTVGYCFRSGNVLPLAIVVLIAMLIIIHYT